MVKKLVKADTEGDFLLHINTVGNLLPVFNGGDSVHYIRCARFYHDQLNSLNTLSALISSALMTKFFKIFTVFAK